MKKKFRYKNIFMYASLQFCGHIDEYFIKHTEKLVIFTIMPRLKNKNNELRVYKMGKLQEKKLITLSTNMVMYYLLWYVFYLKFLFRYFKKQEPIIVLSGHAISFFGMSLVKVFRPVRYAFWIGDYFPPVDLALRLYERIKKFYHDRVDLDYYLGDSINAVVNGDVLETTKKRTVMWGVDKIASTKRVMGKTYSLLFVGLIKDSQGLEEIFEFLATHKNCTASIIGICDNKLYAKYTHLITEYNIRDRVFFPNKFFSEQALRNLAKRSHIGIAMYDTSPLSSSYYTDPGKVKQYVELGLPVIMSNTTPIAPYIQKFHCGEVIAKTSENLEDAIVKIIRNYSSYYEGLQAFARHFYYKEYYAKAFVALEDNTPDYV